MRQSDYARQGKISRTEAGAKFWGGWRKMLEASVDKDLSVGLCLTVAKMLQ